MTTTLDLSRDYATEVLSWYIWGQNSQPPLDKAASEKWIDRQDEIAPKINPDQFFTERMGIEKFI